MTGLRRETIGLELRIEVPYLDDPPVRHVLLEEKQDPNWRPRHVISVRPGASHRVPDLHPGTLYRIRLYRDAVSPDPPLLVPAADTVVAFRTPSTAGRVLLTVVVHCTGFEVSALVDSN
ncbi:hypothetical protein OG196_00425 [Kitasatospora purpeofusca]|uniref:hypothetical protein n=1 Tax=Kitasatospora purpeofusca TaxID=67352 RepID=UPI002E144002|nr:hypothetical protein OG196_00425 [Kitasatospora purpeofusca]